MIYPFFITMYAEKLISHFESYRIKTYRQFLSESLSVMEVYFNPDNYSVNELIYMIELSLEVDRDSKEFKWLFSKEQFYNDSSIKSLGFRLQKLYDIPQDFQH